jgi:serine O-acetyltransferase
VISPEPERAAFWDALRAEAAVLAEREPALASLVHTAVLSHTSLASALAGHLAHKLADAGLDASRLRELARDAYERDPNLVALAESDLLAIRSRDPASIGDAYAFLFFKGFLALESQRLVHWLWSAGRRSLASQLQNRIAEAFDVNVHPAVRFGAGVFIDHGTGIVIGETAEIGDKVAILQGVTLGSVQADGAVRHPQVGEGAELNASATILGGVTIGAYAKVGANALVLESVPPYCTAVGAPARLVNCLDGDALF